MKDGRRPEGCQPEAWLLAGGSARRACSEEFVSFKDVVRIKSLRDLARKNIVAFLVGLLCLYLAVPAFAQPDRLTQKKSQEKDIKSQVSSIDQQLDKAVEDYNQANIALGETEAEIRLNIAKLLKAERDLNRNQALLAKRAVSLYKNRGSSPLEVVFGAESFEEFLLRVSLVTKVAQQDASVIKQVRLEKKEIETRRAALSEQEKRQKLVVAELGNKKNQIEAQIKERESLLASVQGEISSLEREQRASQQRLASLNQSSSRVTVYRGNPGAPHGGVVAIALAQVGKAYRYAAAGPNAFDCSGLMVYCYAQVGISLPHSSAAQYGCGARVSASQLQPGDLVFFGSPIHHVGMYIGGGSYVHASRPGVGVIVSPLNRSDFVGACRP